jgi:hypothetical protein
VPAAAGAVFRALVREEFGVQEAALPSGGLVFLHRDAVGLRPDVLPNAGHLPADLHVRDVRPINPSAPSRCRFGRYTCRILRAIAVNSEMRCSTGLAADQPADSFSTRTWPQSARYTLPAVSTATLCGPSRPSNGSTVWTFNPAANFTTRLVPSST